MTGIARRAARPAQHLQVDRLDEALIRRLQAARAYPSVSVLLTTVPAPMLSSKDVVRLERLVDAAVRRLAAEAPNDHIDSVAARIRQLARHARRQPAGRALALYASHHDAALVHVPVPVADRVVVDPTFATRDLVRAVALRPRFRLVVVSENASRIIEGWPGQLEEVASAGSLPSTSPTERRDDRGRHFGREASMIRRSRADAHVRRVAEQVSARQAAEPLPLIVAGVSRHLAHWRRAAAPPDLLIGTIRGNHDRTPVAALDRLSSPIIEDHIRGIRRAALGRLADTDPALVVGGIDSVWMAATAGRIDMLCVEESFAFPARTDTTGRLRAARDIEHPDVIDDAVDEIIEMASLAGGEVVVVADGELDGCDRIAAIVRTA